MRLDVYVPVLAALLFGGAIRPLSRLWTPRAGARLLVCAGLVSAGCWVWALGLLGWTLLGQVPTVARYGQWSVSVLHRVDPVSPAVAYTAIAILLALTVLVAVTTVRRTRALLRSCSLARSLAPAAHGDLIVVPDDAVDAFALPAFAVPAFVRRVLVSSGRPRLAGPRVPDLDVRRPLQHPSGGGAGGGHVVVTSGMLRALDVGERRALSEGMRRALSQAEADTAGNAGMVLNVCFNYGGRWDIAQAAARLAERGAPITESALASAMALAHVPDPDLLIRTGGEQRISNFLLWQCAYSELYFTDCLWPDFDDAALDEALAAFAGRERRFGRTSEQLARTAAAG